jgi:uncharacterized protein
MKLPPGLVIDTNVVLDWLVFRDPSTDRLGQTLQLQGVRWLVCPSILRELEQVLTRPLPERWDATRKRALTLDWPSMTTTCAEPAPAATAALVCRDRADQKFIDLAVEQRASWLLTRDHALLALQRSAQQRFGIVVATPARWTGIEAATTR